MPRAYLSETIQTSGIQLGGNITDTIQQDGVDWLLLNSGGGAEHFADIAIDIPDPNIGGQVTLVIYARVTQATSTIRYNVQQGETGSLTTVGTYVFTQMDVYEQHSITWTPPVFDTSSGTSTRLVFRLQNTNAQGQQLYIDQMYLDYQAAGIVQGNSNSATSYTITSATETGDGLSGTFNPNDGLTQTFDGGASVLDVEYTFQPTSNETPVAVKWLSSFSADSGANYLVQAWHVANAEWRTLGNSEAPHQAILKERNLGSDFLDPTTQQVRVRFWAPLAGANSTITFDEIYITTSGIPTAGDTGSATGSTVGTETEATSGATGYQNTFDDDNTYDVYTVAAGGTTLEVTYGFNVGSTSVGDTLDAVVQWEQPITSPLTIEARNMNAADLWDPLGTITPGTGETTANYKLLPSQTFTASSDQTLGLSNGTIQIRMSADNLTAGDILNVDFLAINPIPIETTTPTPETPAPAEDFAALAEDVAQILDVVDNFQFDATGYVLSDPMRLVDQTLTATAGANWQQFFANGSMGSITGDDAIVGYVDTQLSTISGQGATLLNQEEILSRIGDYDYGNGNTILTWQQALGRDDVTTPSQFNLNADGSNPGTYDAAQHSQEAIRIRGDANWATPDVSTPLGGGDSMTLLAQSSGTGLDISQGGALIFDGVVSAESEALVLIAVLENLDSANVNTNTITFFATMGDGVGDDPLIANTDAPFDYTLVVGRTDLSPQISFGYLGGTTLRVAPYQPGSNSTNVTYSVAVYRAGGTGGNVSAIGGQDVTAQAGTNWNTYWDDAGAQPGTTLDDMFNRPVDALNSVIYVEQNPPTTVGDNYTFNQLLYEIRAGVLEAEIDGTTKQLYMVDRTTEKSTYRLDSATYPLDIHRES